MSEFATPNRIPLIIPARNEEAEIERALVGLDWSQVRPIISVNDSHDRTAQIARSYTDDVIELGEPGQVNAIQKAVEYLGEMALQPMLVGDADTHHLIEEEWPDAMTRHYDGRTVPGLSTGLITYHGEKPVATAVRTAYRASRSVKSRMTGKLCAIHGSNTSIHLQNPETLDAFLALPNVWRGNDGMMAEFIRDQGGIVTALLDPRSYGVTSARNAVSIGTRLRLGRSGYSQLRDTQYAERKAVGVL